jgi:hypothetical protein
MSMPGQGARSCLCFIHVSFYNNLLKLQAPANSTPSLHAKGLGKQNIREMVLSLEA